MGVERRLYEVVGGWTVAAASPALKIWFSEASQHHAWRAQLWEQRLAGRLVQAYPPPAAQAPPNRGTDEVEVLAAATEAALSAMAALATDPARLGAYCRAILPRCLAGYRAWKARCSSSCDRPVTRALTLVLTDVVGDWQQANDLLTAWLDGPDGLAGLTGAVAGAAQVDNALAGRGLVALAGPRE
jgi:hypothetical protein